MRALSSNVRLAIILGSLLPACSGSAPDEVADSQQSEAMKSQSYLVYFKNDTVPAGAAAEVSAAGGTLVSTYQSLGVVLARASSSTFRSKMSANGDVEEVSGTAGLSVSISMLQKPPHKIDARVPPRPAAGDPLSGMQWDMNQIHAPEARSISSGKRSVLVGVLDSGIDITHPDLRNNIDAAASVSCIGGIPNTDPSTWGVDEIGHGTHVAGIIGAEKNGIGIVGIAPHVRIGSVKIADPNGEVYPEAIVCAFNWVAEHDYDVVNASFTSDPWYFNCRNDPAQRAIWKAETRAAKYAMRRGVSIIAASANNNDDLAHPAVDSSSPTDGTPVTRDIDNSCVVLPVEIPGVIGVSAVGATRQKSFYSNYGLGVIDVAGPGGDFLVQTPEAPSGQIVSSIPRDSFYYQASADWNGQVEDCSSGTCVTYALLQGTSQAAPHVTGVAALAISRHGRMSPRELAETLERTATPLACPPNPYNPAPDFTGPDTCEGRTRYNGFYGHGEVDALAVVR